MKKETREDWEQRVHRVLEKMTGSLDETVLAEQFAGDAASSRWHFERAFRSLTGEPFATCVRRLRLERAAYRLQEGEPVLKTALDAGYESAEAFSRAFRRAFGLAPSRVSSLPWWRGELPSPNGLHWRPGILPHWHLAPESGPDTLTRVLELPPMEILTIEGSVDFWQLPSLWESFQTVVRDSSSQPDQGSFLTVFDSDKNNDVIASPALLVKDISTNWATCLQKKLPGGLYAVTTYTGPCEAIGPYWDSVRTSFFSSGGWATDHERPALEWYQNRPPEELPELTVTFLCDPVKQ